VAECLRQRLGSRIQRILLFGSRARGTGEPASDYDVMVLVDEKTDALEAKVFDLECELSARYNTCINILVREESYFDSRRYEPLFMNVRREGVPL
jgi:hypothetical protein